MRIAWLEEEWNRPSRTDYYIMKLIAVVKGIMSKKSFDFRKEKIKFSSRHKEQRHYRSPEEAAAIAKQSVRSRFPGGRIKKRDS